MFPLKNLARKGLSRCCLTELHLAMCICISSWSQMRCLTRGTVGQFPGTPYSAALSWSSLAASSDVPTHICAPFLLTPPFLRGLGTLAAWVPLQCQWTACCVWLFCMAVPMSNEPALLALGAGNSLVTGGFLTQRVSIWKPFPFDDVITRHSTHALTITLKSFPEVLIAVHDLYLLCWPEDHLRFC